MAYKFCVCGNGGNVIPTPDPDPKPPTCDDCLVGKTIAFNCDNSPLPCGGTMSVDLKEFVPVNACIDENGDPCDVVWSIVNSDDYIVNAAVDSDGIVTFDTGSAAPGEYELQYRVACPCNQLSATGCIRVCAKDLCASANCSAGQKCDPCDGTCIDAFSDLSITSSTSTSSGGSGGGLTIS